MALAYDGARVTRDVDDHDHVSKLAGVVRPLSGTALDPPSPEASSQLTSQLAASLHE
jgi:hypothetical protein